MGKIRTGKRFQGFEGSRFRGEKIKNIRNEGFVNVELKMQNGKDKDGGLRTGGWRT